MAFSIERNEKEPGIYKGLIIDFTRALDIEIKALEGGRGETNLIVRRGEFIDRNLEYYIYRFSADSEVSLDDDTPVDIIIGNDRIDGIVISVDEAGIDIGSAEDLGPAVPEARLKASKTKLLKALMGRLQRVLDGVEGPFNERTSMLLFGYAEPKNVACEPLKLDGYDPSPNDGQKNCIRIALSQDATFIWGPPGTGKTRTLSIILGELIKKKKTVLLTSQTNTAVDEILVKFVRDPKNKTLVDQGKIIRYGTTSNPELKEVLIDNILDRRHAERFEEINKLETLNLQLKEHVDKLTALLNDEHLLELSTEQDKQKQLNGEMDALGKAVSNKNREIDELYAKSLQLRSSFNDAKSLGFLIRVVSGVNLEKLKKDIATTENLLRSVEKALDEYEEKRRVLKGIIDKSNDKILVLKNELPSVLMDLGIDSLEKLRDTLHATLEYIEDNDQRISQLNEEIQSDEESIFNDAQVIGATLTRIYLDPKLFRRRFDVMILDEASMAPLPSVFFASGLASQCIVSGDFRQLPPIANSDDIHVKKWLKKDIFDQTGVLAKIEDGMEDKRVVMLQEQYRMHPRIVGLINDKMYQGKLKTPESTRLQTEQLAMCQPYEGQSVIFCDTSSVNPWCISAKNSRINLYTAMLSVKIADMALSSGARSVGIITPYKLQSNTISNELEAMGIDKAKAIASTIHRFQGNQKECIILDLVDGPPFGTIGMPLRGVSVSSDTGRMLNVALSRAQGKIVIIANKQYLYKKLGKDSIAYKILMDAERTGVSIDSKSLLSFADLLEKRTPSSREVSMDEGMTQWNETTFYDQFLEDIERAKSRIVIFSPFIARKRMAMLIDQLRLAVERGVDVYIITRNPRYKVDNTDLQDLVEEVKKTGIKVITPSKKLGLKEDFHEKYALIDKTVFYFGSLNILSQSTSSEVMLAFRSRNTIEGLIQNLNIERLLQSYDWSNPNPLQEKIDPMRADIANAHYTVGIALIQRGQYEKAIEELKTAIKLNTNKAEYHYNLGIALIKIGNNGEAKKELEKAINLNSNNQEYQESLKHIGN